MSNTDSSFLATALQTLKDYGPGSSRAALLPIDTAVREALNDTAQQQTLERQLLVRLEESSIPGQTYLMTQLALVGSAQAVDPLADRLFDPNLADPACRALEALPCPQASEALRGRLSKLEGNALVGVITVLGRKRDRACVRLLAKRLADRDRSVVGASLTALGRIASPAAGRVLRKALSDPPPGLHSWITQAARDCADRLVDDGRKRDAEALREVIEKTLLR